MKTWGRDRLYISRLEGPWLEIYPRQWRWMEEREFPYVPSLNLRSFSLVGVEKV